MDSELVEQEAAGHSTSGAEDGRRAVAYLVAPESDEYIAVMSVLEASPTDLTPAEVAAALKARGFGMDLRVVEARLAQLREWSAASARSDQAHVRRVQDLLLRNFRYTATRQGRQVQRFYETVLAGTTVMREIPLQSLNAVVVALESLAAPDAPSSDVQWVRSRVNEVFTAHDDLDGSLIGAEDTLMGLADHFDLDDDDTGELKTLLVGYATRVAVDLERGSDRASLALRRLTEQFAALAGVMVAASEASDLIGRDLLAASKGGDVRDWHGITAWFDPARGRAARFQARMINAIPTFHANLRRLHTAGESGTSRARALVLARACLHPELGPQLFLAAVGDHPWRLVRAVWEGPPAANSWVFVTENPSVLAAAADVVSRELDIGPVRLLCTMGTPSRREVAAIARIAATGWQVAVRADFDPAGLRHVGSLLREVPGAAPWRMHTQDYLESRATTPLNAPVPLTPWDPALADRLGEAGLAAFEEALLPALLDDLRRGRPG
jgi:hypothetical protein